MRSRAVFVVVVTVIGALSSACNECDYWQQCGEEPGELLVCGEGIDQQFGRTPRSITCPSPNATCVDVTDTYGACAFSQAPCAENAAPRCEGDVLVRCLMIGETAEAEFPDVTEGADEELVESGETCANGCVESGGRGACVD